MTDPRSVVGTTCEHCRRYFEDYEVAVRMSGGWCPFCDKPARKRSEEYPEQPQLSDEAWWEHEMREPGAEDTPP